MKLKEQCKDKNFYDMVVLIDKILIYVVRYIFFEYGKEQSDR